MAETLAAEASVAETSTQENTIDNSQTLTFWTDPNLTAPPQLNSLEQTASYFGFNNIEELEEFWQSNNWKLYADQLRDNVIIPEREQAHGTGITRTLSQNFVIVETWIIDGIAGRNDTYEDPHPDTSNFDRMDWYCFTICQLLDRNSRYSKGLFRRKYNISDHQKLCLIWSMLQVWIYETDPSRIASRKRAAEALDKDAKRRKIDTIRPLSGSAVIVSHENDVQNDDKKKLDNDSCSEGVESTADSDAVQALIDFASDPHAPIGDTSRAAMEQHFSTSTHPGILQWLAQAEPRAVLTSLQQMNIEHYPGDTHSRAHNYSLAVAATEGYRDLELLPQANYGIHDRCRTLDNIAWQRQIADTTTDYCSDLADEVRRATYIHNQTLLENSASQPQDYSAACDRMGLKRYDHPRYDTMPTTIAFKPWQVVAIDQIHAKKESGLNGVLLCDSMGLGKTWQVVGYILSKCHIRRQAKTAGQQVEPARPTLVVVPSGMLPNHLTNEVVNITEELSIVRYWGNLRDPLASSRRNVLAKDDDLFADDERNATTIVITTYQIWQSRHGPSAQKAFHVKDKKWTLDRAKRESHLPDDQWPHLLQGCFSDVVAIEATAVKSEKSPVHTALKWLQAFTILVTATPDIDSAHDFEGYIDFIQPSKEVLLNQVYSKGIPASINPYITLSTDDAQGMLLRCTSEHFKRWVLDQPQLIQQSSYMRILYGDCMIRRSYVSSINGKTIGADIPALKHRRGECLWFTRTDHGNMTDEFKDYEALAKPRIEALLRVDAQDNIIWNWEHFRGLVQLSTWLGFAQIEDKIRAESMSTLIYKGSNLLEWIVAQFCTATGKSIPQDEGSRLSVVCAGAPKIRALLQLVAGVVLLGKQKMLVFCTTPAQQLLVFAVLKSLRISTRIYHTDLTKSEKLILQRHFSCDNEPKVLIGSFATTSVGMNLQKQCNWVVFLDPPPSIEVGEHAVSRCHRVGQQCVVEAVTLVTKQSFDDRHTGNGFQRALPDIVAALSKEAFMGMHPECDSNGDEKLAHGPCVIHNGQIKRADDPVLPSNHNLRILKGEQLVKAIIGIMMGDEISQDSGNYAAEATNRNDGGTQ